ncbi:MAG: hypothetical protein R6V58_01215, partial [Planctomycetota bacterium]
EGQQRGGSHGNDHLDKAFSQLQKVTEDGQPGLVLIHLGFYKESWSGLFGIGLIIAIAFRLG